MLIKTCVVVGCEKQREGRTLMCASCNRNLRKQLEQSKKEERLAWSKVKVIHAPKKPIAKVGTKNTWQCSSGKRVTQQEINRYRDAAYNEKSKSTDMTICEGCGKPANCWAHIIAQARCKAIGKTELIWHLGNFFRSCYGCNSAIESPKGIAWNGLKNIGECLAFMEKHDRELFMKFSVSGTFEL